MKKIILIFLAILCVNAVFASINIEVSHEKSNVLTSAFYDEQHELFNIDVENKVFLKLLACADVTFSCGKTGTICSNAKQTLDQRYKQADAQVCPEDENHLSEEEQIIAGF